MVEKFLLYDKAQYEKKVDNSSEECFQRINLQFANNSLWIMGRFDIVQSNSIETGKTKQKVIPLTFVFLFGPFSWNF